MADTNVEADSVVIGGRKVSLLVAALMAQEAERLGIPPRQVRAVAVPECAPETVELAGRNLSIRVAALLAAKADELGFLVVERQQN